MRRMDRIYDTALHCYCGVLTTGHHQECDLSVQGLRRARRRWRSQGWPGDVIKSTFRHYKDVAAEELAA